MGELGFERVLLREPGEKVTMKPERRGEEARMLKKKRKLQKNIFNKASAGPGSVVCAKVG